MYKTLVLAIGISFCGVAKPAFDVNEWQPVADAPEEQAGTMTEVAIKKALRQYLQPIEAMPLRAVRVVSYLKVLSSLCEDTEMLPLERLIWANVARQEIGGRLVSETGISLSELSKKLPRGVEGFDGNSELSTTAHAAQLVREIKMENLDGMEEMSEQIQHFMRSALPDLLTVGDVAVPSGFDVAAHSEMVEQMLTEYINNATVGLKNQNKRREKEVVGLACSLGAAGAAITLLAIITAFAHKQWLWKTPDLSRRS